MMLYLTTTISESMFGDAESTILRKRISATEAKELLTQPYTVSIFRSPKDNPRYDEISYLLQERGFDTSQEIRVEGRASWREGDELLLVRVIRGPKEPKVRFSLWQINEALA